MPDLTAAKTEPAREKLRVVTMIDVLSPTGGAERLAAQITKRLDPARYDRTICVTRRAKEPALSEVQEAGVRVLQLRRGSKVALWEWRPLLSLLRRERVDVVHTHQFGSNVWGSLLSRLAGVPAIVAHEHTWSFEGQRLRRLLDREIVGRYADVVLAVSREDRRRMVEIERIDPGRIRYLPNGIPPLPAPAARDVRAELGIDRDAVVVGTVSVLRPQKALEVLLNAIVVLKPQFPQLKVIVVGRGPERDALEALAGELGLNEVVEFLGLRTDVPDLLRIFDVAVSSSDFEGSPLAVMEYMAAGRAIVATAVGGVPDLIEDGVHGLLVPRREPEALAAAIATLLHRPDLRARLGAAAQERQRREFDLDVMVDRVELLYEELVAANGRRR